MEPRHLKHLHFFVCLVIATVTVSSKNLPDSDTSSALTISDGIEWNILMRDAKPPEPDAYLCTAYPVEYDEAFIYKFEALADASTAHHMLLYGCDGEEYEHTGPIWPCPRMCKGNALTIMFAWAKNAPATVFPKGVGLRIGQRSRIKTIVLQVHYAKSFSANEHADNSGLKLFITHQRQPFSAGILLMMSAWFAIPPHKSSYPVDMSCEYTRENSIFPFAYRTHSHGLGKVITGYQHNGSYHMIGKGNPQWPQAFYPVKSNIEVKQHDKLAARCTYDSTGKSITVRVGPTGDDEMCNFYIMYYTNSSYPDEPMECLGNSIASLTGNNFPDDVSVPLPHNALLEEEATGHHHHSHHQSVVISPPDVAKTTQPPKTVEDIHIEKKLIHQYTWHTLDMGQVGGVSVDKDGNVYIFHRANRRWDVSSFDYDNNFRYQNAPIDDDVVMVVDKNGKLLRKFGKGEYFMPHGIHVDFEGNIWLTDVALHQVFKIPKGETKPVLTLGHRFKHNNDLSYFCKPTDVAVISTGEFFVSDGYCNSRIMKFSKDGKLLKSWGKKSLSLNPEPFAFYVVHSLAVSEKDNTVCAADRENGRIQCFDLNGNYKHIIKHNEFGSSLYAVDYSPRHGGVLYAVNGQDVDGTPVTVQGFTMDMKNGAIIEQWNVQQGLKRPHDICVDPSSESIYVGELDPSSVWKMTRMSSDEAKAYFAASNHHDDDDDDDDDHHDGKNAIDNVKKEDKVDTTPTLIEKISTPSNISNSSSPLLQKSSKSTGGLTASMIMGIILVVPVVLLLVGVLIARSYQSGNFKFFTGGGKKRIFNMQHILGNSHKGFDPLSTEESDHDLDPDDSDHEEYAAPKKNKT